MTKPLLKTASLGHDRMELVSAWGKDLIRTLEPRMGKLMDQATLYQAAALASEEAGWDFLWDVAESDVSRWQKVLSESSSNVSIITSAAQSQPDSPRQDGGILIDAGANTMEVDADLTHQDESQYQNANQNMTQQQQQQAHQYLVKAGLQAVENFGHHAHTLSQLLENALPMFPNNLQVNPSSQPHQASNQQKKFIHRPNGVGRAGVQIDVKRGEHGALQTKYLGIGASQNEELNKAFESLPGEVLQLNFVQQLLEQEQADKRAAVRKDPGYRHLSQSELEAVAVEEGKKASDSLSSLFRGQCLRDIEARMRRDAYFGTAVFKEDAANHMSRDKDYMRWSTLHKYRTELHTAPVLKSNSLAINANEAFIAQAAELYKVQCPVCQGFGHTKPFCSTLPRLRAALGTCKEVNTWFSNAISRPYPAGRPEDPGKAEPKITMRLEYRIPDGFYDTKSGQLKKKALQRSS